MVWPSAAAGFWAAVGLQRCTIIAACLSHALRSLVSAAVTTLMTNHIHFASHHASYSSDLIGGGSVSYNFVLVQVINFALSLGPAP